MKHPTAFKPAGRSCYYFNYTDRDRQRRRRSTGCNTRDAADDEIRRFMTSLAGPGRSSATFAQYSAPFFIWDRCPHVARLLDSGRSIGLQHVETCRRWLDNWVLTDIAFAQQPMREITRGDLLDLRKRLRARVLCESTRRKGDGLPTVNKVMAAVKTIFREAYFREDLPANPADGVGDISYEEGGPDIFTLGELRGMFGGPDPGTLAYRVFKTAAWTGMRCGEILGGGVGQLSDGIFSVDHAWKHHKAEETGDPKWGKKRLIALAPTIRTDLERWIGERSSGLIFAYEDGRRLHAGWWRESFKALLKSSQIAIGARHLTPHSLRHSLNTHLLEAGVDPLRVQVYLWGTKVEAGHAGIQRQGITKTQSLYTHFQAAMTEPVAKAIEGLLGAQTAERVSAM